MELGATMELLGEEVGQLWGRRPPYIVGGTNQPLPPFCPEESTAVLPLATISGTTAPKRGTTAWPTVVLPRWEGGTAAQERYYGLPQPRPVP